MHEEIQQKMKEAMKAKGSVRVTVLRGLLSAFTNELVATKRMPTEKLPDEEILGVIQKAVKQRKDSIAQFEKGGRSDLAQNEKEELRVLEEFLPPQMSQDEIRPLAEAKKAEMGITDRSKAGMLTGALMKDLKGKADGNDVKSVVDSLF